MVLPESVNDDSGGVKPHQHHQNHPHIQQQGIGRYSLLVDFRHMVGYIQNLRSSFGKKTDPVFNLALMS